MLSLHLFGEIRFLKLSCHSGQCDPAGWTSCALKDCPFDSQLGQMPGFRTPSAGHTGGS